MPPKPSKLHMASASGAISAQFQAGGGDEDRAPARRAPGWVSEVLDREGPGILRLLWRLLRNEADVLDAFQDCFCRLATCSTVPDRGGRKAYAYRTAANIATELARVRIRRNAHLPRLAEERGETCVDDEPEDRGADRFDPLRQAIARLPAHLRNVVVLRDLNKLSYEEVGRMLSIDPATARVYRRHAVVRLAELLDEGNGDERDKNRIRPGDGLS